jgi:hypothetical protein
MIDYREQTWVLDMTDRHNCSILESLKPGEPREVRAIVHEEPTKRALVKALRTSDGQFRAPLPDGLSIEMLYIDLLRLIEDKKPDM